MILAIQLVVAYAMVCFALFLICEQAQRFLYDQLVEGFWWRVLAGSAPLAILLVVLPCKLETMFTIHILYTIVHVAAWFLVLWLLLEFMPMHAFAVGSISFLLVSWIATMALETMVGSPESTSPFGDSLQPPEPVEGGGEPATE